MCKGAGESCDFVSAPKCCQEAANNAVSSAPIKNTGFTIATAHPSKRSAINCTLTIAAAQHGQKFMAVGALDQYLISVLKISYA